MVFNPINMELYDKVQVEMGYCKLFPHIVQDFVTRKDMLQILAPTNLPVNTGVNTIVAGQAGQYTVVATGTGSGTGTVSPVYKGSTLSPASTALQKQKEVALKAGGTIIKGTIEG